ncbi:hypothetical protein QUF75_20505 [Desulfococcaceae bacterium HSG7]|nr:hypothetical protein [Desulfococcaceae bacterium HSG7]
MIFYVKRCMSIAALLLILAGLILITLTQNSNAMPAFARKYQTSCVTCHATYPRLNAVGEAYRSRGFRFPDDEMYRKREPLELGDEAYKAAKAGQRYFIYRMQGAYLCQHFG